MKFDARIKKLEAKQKRVLRCVWCHYCLRTVSPQQRSRRSVAPSNFLTTKCWFCGTPFIVGLHGYDDHQREALNLIYNSHPTKQFTDERIHAVGIWFSLSFSEVKKLEESEAKAASFSRRSPSYYSHQVLPTPAEKKIQIDRDALEYKAKQFRFAQIARFKKLANGPESFPVDLSIARAETEQTASNYRLSDELFEELGFSKYSHSATKIESGLNPCESALINLKKRRACELVIWGKCLSRTSDEIAFFEGRQQQVVNDALDAKHRDEEEKRRKEAERLEAEQRQAKVAEEKAEREAEQLRIRQQQERITAQLIEESLQMPNYNPLASSPETVAKVIRYHRRLPERPTRYRSVNDVQSPHDQWLASSRRYNPSR